MYRQVDGLPLKHATFSEATPPKAWVVVGHRTTTNPLPIHGLNCFMEFYQEYIVLSSKENSSLLL